MGIHAPLSFLSLSPPRLGPRQYLKRAKKKKLLCLGTLRFGDSLPVYGEARKLKNERTKKRRKRTPAKNEPQHGNNSGFTRHGGLLVW